jgi:hypothetical protein
LGAFPGKFVAAVANAVLENRTRDFFSVLAVWLLLALALIFMARPNSAVPGLYYDEAQCAGMARDFLTGHPHPHIPGYEVINIGGRPFPTFVQAYGGAVKSWLLLPGFAVFGASLAVLRMSALGWGLVALLFFMLWTWRWLGRDTALLAGILLALDPTFFFISVLDWGPVLPSFLCRFACFNFALRWWQVRNDGVSRGFFFAFLAGFFAGLGFFNKIDFAVLLAGVLLALVCCNARSFGTHFVSRRFSNFASPLAFAGLGFLLTAGPMLGHLPGILQYLHSAGKPGAESTELTEKFNALLAMYNGSYFYRLMDAGGLFSKMYQNPAPIFSPIGVTFILAAAYLIGAERLRVASGNVAAFLLLATLFITIGIFLMPGAVRIHHMVLVYPFPHLVVALAVTRLWRRGHRLSSLVAALFVLLVASQLFALHRTQQLIRQTGGRGWWSDALNAFARQMKDRSDLTIVSLDWGFNEQLAFLTDGPVLTELFWEKTTAVPRFTNCVYLVHPPEYNNFKFGQPILEEARRAGPSAFEIQPWYDHQNHVVFFAIRARGP